MKQKQSTHTTGPGLPRERVTKVGIRGRSIRPTRARDRTGREDSEMATDEQTETLEQTVRLEAIGASMRFEGPDEESQEERWRLAVRPLIEQRETMAARIAKLEIDAARETELATLDGAEMAEMRAKIASADESRRGCERRIEQLTRREESLVEHAQGLDREIDKLKLYVDALKSDLDVARAALLDDDEIERLTTTIDVLAGRLAARGQS